MAVKHTGTYDFAFNFDKGPYILAFRPNVDDMGVIQIEQEKKAGGSWALGEKRPFVGTHCFECAGDKDSETDAWVFSRGFHFNQNEEYETVIYYRGGGTLSTDPTRFKGVEGTREKNNARFALWLCTEQSARSGISRLTDVGIAHTHYQFMRVIFRVNETATYFFGGQALIRPSTGEVALGLMGVSLVGGLDDWL